MKRAGRRLVPTIGEAGACFRANRACTAAGSLYIRGEAHRRPPRQRTAMRRPATLLALSLPLLVPPAARASCRRRGRRGGRAGGGTGQGASRTPVIEAGRLYVHFGAPCTA